MDSSPRVMQINEEANYKITALKGTVVVYYYSQSCWPCKIVSPVFDSYSHDEDFERIGFAKIDSSVSDPKLRKKLSELDIAATPTFILFHDGTVVDRVVGADTELLIQMLERAAELEDKQAAK